MPFHDKLKNRFGSIKDFVTSLDDKVEAKFFGGEDLSSVFNKGLKKVQDVVQDAPVSIGGNFGAPQATGNLKETTNLLFGSREDLQDLSDEDLLRMGIVRGPGDMLLGAADLPGVGGAPILLEVFDAAMDRTIRNLTIQKRLVRAKTAKEVFAALEPINTALKVKSEFASRFSVANTLEEVQRLAAEMQQAMTAYKIDKRTKHLLIEGWGPVEQGKWDSLNNIINRGHELSPGQDALHSKLQSTRFRLGIDKIPKSTDVLKKGGKATVGALIGGGAVAGGATLGILGGAKDIAQDVKDKIFGTIGNIADQTEETFRDRFVDKPDEIPSINHSADPTYLPNKLVAGYDFAAWNAADQGHANKVSSIYSELSQRPRAPETIQADIDRIDAINKKTPSLFGSAEPGKSKITGQMIFDIANELGVDPFMLAAVGRQDSGYGTRGRGANDINFANVGTFDNQVTSFDNWEDSVRFAAQFLQGIRTTSSSPLRPQDDIFDVDIQSLPQDEFQNIVNERTDPADNSTLLDRTRNFIRSAPVGIGGSLGAASITKNLGESMDLIFGSREDMSKMSNEELLSIGMIRIAPDLIIAADPIIGATKLTGVMHVPKNMRKVLTDTIDVRAGGPRLPSIVREAVESVPRPTNVLPNEAEIVKTVQDATDKLNVLLKVADGQELTRAEFNTFISSQREMYEDTIRNRTVNELVLVHEEQSIKIVGGEQITKGPRLTQAERQTLFDLRKKPSRTPAEEKIVEELEAKLFTF